MCTISISLHSVYRLGTGQFFPILETNTVVNFLITGSKQSHQVRSVALP